MRTLTQEDFLARATAGHGGRYGYTRTHYVNKRTKVTVTCPEHGDFLVRPPDHTRGSGCPRCLDSKTSLVGRRFGKLVVLEKSHNERGDVTWKCVCDCGGTKEIVTGNLINQTRSCGCIWRVPYLKGDEASFRNLYAHYKANAKKGFHLSPIEFREITSSACYYCDAPPAQVWQKINRENAEYKPEPYLYNGIDRRDNALGYTAANAVPCCRTCNFMKGRLSVAAFLEQVRKIGQHQGVVHD